MGDCNENNPDPELTQKPTPASAECEAKPSTNTLEDPITNITNDSSLETVFKNVTPQQSSNLEVESTKTSEDKLTRPLSIIEGLVEKKPCVSSATTALSKAKEKILRNQSDIFSDKESNMVASIFSVNGAPSRRIFRRPPPNSAIFPLGVPKLPENDPPSEKLTTPIKEKMLELKENVNDLRRPSSAFRNPLTGTGMSSNDEYKFKASKRKDGNPLLGLGYDTASTSPSSQRIPPGGYSHKLW